MCRALLLKYIQIVHVHNETLLSCFAQQATVTAKLDLCRSERAKLEAEISSENETKSALSADDKKLQEEVRTNVKWRTAVRSVVIPCLRGRVRASSVTAIGTCRHRVLRRCS